MHERLVHDADLLPARGFMGKVAADEARDAKRIEVPGRSHEEIDDRNILFALASDQGKAIAAIPAGKGNGVGAGNGHDSGQSGHLFAQLRKELRRSLRGVAVHARIDRHHQQSAGTKADVDVRGVLQAAQQ